MLVSRLRCHLSSSSLNQAVLTLATLLSLKSSSALSFRQLNQLQNVVIRARSDRGCSLTLPDWALLHPTLHVLSHFYVTVRFLTVLARL